MAKYAVLRINGNQYKVAEGEEFFVDYLGDEQPRVDVLLVSDGTSVKIGKPILKNAKLSMKVVEKKVKGKKLTVSKYKAKSRYRRKIGFRPTLSKLALQKIV